MYVSPVDEKYGTEINSMKNEFQRQESRLQYFNNRKDTSS